MKGGKAGRRVKKNVNDDQKKKKEETLD